ncbi:MAG: MBL fold metallo-hydrolase [archaeon]
MITPLKDNIWQLHFRAFSSCVYLIKNPEPILIDTGSKEAEQELIADLKSLFIEPEDIKAVILTHSHWDHTGNINSFKNAKIYPSNNVSEIKKDFPDFEIIETPGHTRNDICILYEDILFSGDTIFENGYIGRTDFPESSPEKMQASLAKLKNIKYKILAPGHLVN